MRGLLQPFSNIYFSGSTPAFQTILSPSSDAEAIHADRICFQSYAPYYCHKLLFFLYLRCSIF